MNIKLIGTGAAGNKAAIEAINSGIIEASKVKLVNSTIKDIPENFRESALTFSPDKISGCGKERDMAKKLTLDGFRNGSLNDIQSFITPFDSLVVLVTSTEGGSGSGSVIIMAKYIKDVLGVPVMIFGITGFEEDGRGLQNTIEFFQDLNEDYTVQAISNKKFLDGGRNYIKAEKLANQEFVKRLSVILEDGIVDSEQNLDPTDMFKTVTSSGFMTIHKIELGKLKNVEQFNKIINESIDDDKSVDIQNKSQTRLAVFINAKKETLDIIDFSFTAIKDKLGNVYEVYKHVQYNSELPEFISFISSGLKMPLDALKEIHEKYKAESMKVNKDKDTFFNFASDLAGNKEDTMFNIKKSKQVKDLNSFLNDFGLEEEKEEPKSELDEDKLITKAIEQY